MPGVKPELSLQLENRVQCINVLLSSLENECDNVEPLGLLFMFKIRWWRT